MSTSTTFADTLSVEEAASLMKVHRKTVEELIADGELPAAKIGRSWVMLKTHVMKYIENQVMKQTAARLGVTT